MGVAPKPEGGRPEAPKVCPGVDPLAGPHGWACKSRAGDGGGDATESSGEGKRRKILEPGGGGASDDVWATSAPQRTFYLIRILKGGSSAGIQQPGHEREFLLKLQFLQPRLTPRTS